MKNSRSIQHDSGPSQDLSKDFESFFHKYYPILFKLGYATCGDKHWTKDLLQSFFLNLLENDFQAQKIQYLETYLKKSFYRKVVKAIKKEQSFQKRIKLHTYNKHTPSYEDLLIHLEDDRAKRKNLQEALKLLPDQQKVVLEMKFKNGMDCQSIAEATGKSTQTVYNQLFSAIKKLRKALTVFL